MKRYAIINQKGGVGKTVTAVNLSYNLAKGGARVCLIDFDPQAHATLHLGLKKAAFSSYHFLKMADNGPTYSIKEFVQSKHGIDVIPSSRQLTKAANEMASELGSLKFLKRAISLAKIHDHYDYLIIDAPPQPGYLNNISIVAADLIIPVELKAFSLQACKDTIDTLKVIKEEVNGCDSVVAGILPTFLNKSKREMKSSLDRLHSHFEDILFSPIRDNTSISEASGHGLPVELYAPNSRGANDYRILKDELLARGRKK